MHFIGGKWVEGEGHAFTSSDPATGNVIWSGKAADAAQVAEAVAAAKKAFPAWENAGYAARLETISKFYALIDSKKDVLAELISEETGKVLWDAKGEVAAVSGKLKFSTKAYEQRTGSSATDMGGFNASLRHRAHGVMAVYGPYNFPAHLPNGHITPALLAGNTVVFKPSELTPKVAEFYVKCWEESGFPSGVLNLIQGEKDTGVALANAPIDGLLFTGSSATGKILHKQFAGRPEVLLALEMGGNNALVVDGVSDVKAAAYETIQSAFLSSGQRCTCARRLIVVESANTHDFLSELVAMAGSLKIGPHTERPEPFMGPLVSNREAGRILDAQKTLVSQGAKILLESRRLHENQPLITPAIVDITGLKGIPDEEYFGPLLQVIRVADWEAAIAAANATNYGLSAGLLCDDPERYKDFVRRVRAGIINWNKQTTGASGAAPFGGVGCSGNHHPAGYYAADYCAYPVASMESTTLKLPEVIASGVTI